MPSTSPSRFERRLLPVECIRDAEKEGERDLTDYVSDAPIEDARHDRFGRGNWARRVAETIAAQGDPSSLVVGIYGPWGDGKTSALNLIVDELEKSPEVVPVRFNPWRLGDESEMFQGFFATLADALDERVDSNTQRVGQALRDYGGLLVAVPVVGAALKEGAGAAGGRLSETNLNKQRKKIEDLLKKHGKRVVILIDDIDRLDKGEVQAMFRLVKIAADFRHTAYILAFDHRVVASALAERYAEAGHGANFMDKIIQLPLHLPAAPPEQIRTIALEGVTAALDQANITLTSGEIGAFVSTFDRAVGPRLTTPRAAKRYSNALRFSLPMMAGEVNPVDLMLVEAMRVCYPSLYEWVRSHEHEVLGTYSSQTDRDAPELVATRAAFEAATDELTAEAASRARVLLTTLLPRTESAWENKTWGHDWDDEWAGEKRLGSKLYFRRYFSYAVPPGDVPDADLNALLAAVQDPAATTAEVIQLALAVLDSEGAEKVLPKLSAQVPELGSKAAEHLARAITAVSDRMPNTAGFLGLSTRDRAAVLVRDLIGQVHLDERGQLAAGLVRDAEHLPFAIEVIRWLRPQESHMDRAVLTREECDAAGRGLADRLVRVWCSGEPFTEFSDKVAASLHVCTSYGDGDAVRDCLRRRISEDLSEVFGIMQAFTGTAWSLETGVPLEPRFHREAYDALREYIDPSWLFPRLRERYGDTIGQGHEDVAQSRDEEERFADSYARFYRADIGKTIDHPSADQTGGAQSS